MNSTRTSTAPRRTRGWLAEPIVLGLAVTLAACASTLPPASELTTGRATTAKPEDRVTISQERGATVIDVDSPSGVGGAAVTLTTCEWPEPVLVRLHGFSTLEQLTVAADRQRLTCIHVAGQQGEAEHRCTLGSEQLATVQRAGDYLEVTLPAKLLASQPASISLQWAASWKQ